MLQRIEVKNLSKNYGEKQVLDSVSFSVGIGETFGLLGVNGAGKTTTIECIEGLRKPDSGEITVGGFEVSKSLSSVQKILGVQLQSTALPDVMTSKEAMKLFCAWHHIRYREDLLERFDMNGEYLQNIKFLFIFNILQQ